MTPLIPRYLFKFYKTAYRSVGVIRESEPSGQLDRSSYTIRTAEHHKIIDINIGHHVRDEAGTAPSNKLFGTQHTCTKQYPGMGLLNGSVA